MLNHINKSINTRQLLKNNQIKYDQLKYDFLFQTLIDLTAYHTLVEYIGHSLDKYSVSFYSLGILNQKNRSKKTVQALLKELFLFDLDYKETILIENIKGNDIKFHYSKIMHNLLISN